MSFWKFLGSRQQNLMSIEELLPSSGITLLCLFQFKQSLFANSFPLPCYTGQLPSIFYVLQAKFLLIHRVLPKFRATQQLPLPALDLRHIYIYDFNFTMEQPDLHYVIVIHLTVTNILSCDTFNALLICRAEIRGLCSSLRKYDLVF